MSHFGQWCNRRRGTGEECPPETSDREISADLPEKRGKEKGVKIEKKRRKIVKASHFSKPLKFVLGLPKWKFSTGKKHLTPGKNQEKWLCPLRKFFLLHPWFWGSWFPDISNWDPLVEIVSAWGIETPF